MENKDIKTTDDWCEVTEVGLRVMREPTWDEYQQEWNKWEFIHSTSAWALGDLLAYGERTWGETYVQVAAHTKYSIGYLRNIQYVCSNVLMNNRRIELSMSHHQAAAKLESHIQRAWLEYAVEKDLTRDEFRAVATNDKMPPLIELENGYPNNLQYVLPKPAVLTLEQIVVAYIRAVKANSDDALVIFQEMENFIGDLL